MNSFDLRPSDGLEVCNIEEMMPSQPSIAEKIPGPEVY
jgi:hypothetical protein